MPPPKASLFVEECCMVFRDYAESPWRVLTFGPFGFTALFLFFKGFVSGRLFAITGLGFRVQGPGLRGLVISSLRSLLKFHA